MNLASWTDFLTQSPWILLFVIGLFAALESVAIIGLILPGTVMMAMVSSLAGTIQLPVPLVLVSGAIGAIIGDGMSYWLGKSQSHRILRVWPLSNHPEWLERGKRFFQRHGALSVLLGRFVGPVRPLVPMIAGMMSMSPRSFTVVNVASAIGWAPLYILPGYYLGQAWRESYRLSQDTTMWLIEFTFVVLIALLTFSWLRSLFVRPRIGYRSVLGWARQSNLGRRLWRRAQRISNHREPPVGPLLLLLVSLALLVIWTSIVIAHKYHPMIIDQRSQTLFAELAFYHWPQQISAIIDRAADTWGIILIVLPWLSWWLYKRYYVVCIHWMAALCLLGVLNTLIKHCVARPRPDAPEWLAHSFSYPSAHTSATVLIFGLFAAFIAERIPMQRRNWPYWVATLLCIIVAISRLAFGVHWASDLVGGALLGLILCAGVRVSYPFYARRQISWAHWHWLLIASILLVTIRVIWLLYP